MSNKPRDILSLEYGAQALRHRGKEEEALPQLEKAVNLSKTDTRLINALGTAYKELGHLGKARDCFQRATALKPRLGKAYWNRSDLITTPEIEINTLEKNLQGLSARSKELPYFHFSLFRLYEKLGDVETAFQYLEKGNAAKKALLQYQVEPDLTMDQANRQFFRDNYAAMQQKIADSSVQFLEYHAIFIVGMPRSGTSLVEQILASHSLVEGGGELPLLTRATETQLHRLCMSKPFPECLPDFSAGDFARLGLLYQQLAASYLKGCTILTDKYLLNSKAVPLIKLVLPDAKIVHVRRDRMDTCFGCYRQLFTTGLGFCYDLEDIAKTWHSYDQSMEVWRELMPGQFYTCEYEYLINHQKEATRGLLEFSALPWEGSCLNFHAAERTVKTASSLQVREPVFNQSISRWKRHKKELAPLENLLAESSWFP